MCAADMHVVTDERGRFNATLPLAPLLRLETPFSEEADFRVEVVAYWRYDVANDIEVSKIYVPITGTDYPGAAPVVTSSDTQYPGVQFSISPGRRSPGASATVFATRVPDALCRALATCRQVIPTAPARLSSTYGVPQSRATSFKILMEEEAALLRINRTDLCEGLSLDVHDWSQCRWELPGPGLFAIVVCIRREGSDVCYVTYR
jgi:hypothetical protein